MEREIDKFENRKFVPCNKLIHSYKPNIPIYYNGITNIKRANNLRYNLFDFNTKQDLEDPHLKFDLLKEQIEACHELLLLGMDTIFFLLDLGMDRYCSRW